MAALMSSRCRRLEEGGAIACGLTADSGVEPVDAVQARPRIQEELYWPVLHHRRRSVLGGTKDEASYGSTDSRERTEVLETREEEQELWNMVNGERGAIY
ncbi:unnamed protein product [Urochloa humidicola]